MTDDSATTRIPPENDALEAQQAVRLEIRAELKRISRVIHDVDDRTFQKLKKERDELEGELRELNALSIDALDDAAISRECVAALNAVAAELRQEAARFADVAQTLDRVRKFVQIAEKGVGQVAKLLTRL